MLTKFNLVKVESKEKLEYEGLTYDLEVEDDHSYVANNYIVHNSVCTTRIVTGVGYPQLSAVMECADAAHGLGGHIIADGGCTSPGDVVKAFAGGADFVMLGGMLAGHNEGEVQQVDNEVSFHGMSSDKAMEIHGARKDGYRGPEGKEAKIPYRGSVNNTIPDILGGLRSACTYVGAIRLKDLSKCATFIRCFDTYNRIFENAAN